MNAALTNNLIIPSPPIAILGVPFDNVTASQAITMIDKMVSLRRPHYLVTANVDFLVQAREDVELRRILFDAHLVLCDGTPLLWASRLLGNPLPERVAGADLVPLLIKNAAQKKYRLFFLGATPESSGQAVQKLKALYPSLLIMRHLSTNCWKWITKKLSGKLRKPNPTCFLYRLAAPSRKNGSRCIIDRWEFP